MTIRLSDHFSYKRLLRFTLPSIASMVFTSIYGVVDGFFVSNFVGKDPFTGLNIIMPVVMILGAIGSMIGTGGAALISKLLGEGKQEKANKLLSFFVYGMVLAGIIMSIIGTILMPQIADLLGAEGEVLTHAITYGRFSMIGLTFLGLQYAMQSFLIAAEKPQLGLIIIIAAGIVNILLDALFIVVFKWGLIGAAVATALGQVIASVVPIVLFARRKNNWPLHLGKPTLDWKSLGKACLNGSSEFLSIISMSIVAILFNSQLLKYAGNDGVAAYGAVMYANMIFVGIAFGFTMGTSPLISYHYGAKNHKELKNILKKSCVIIGVVSVLMAIACELLSEPLAHLFAGYDESLLALTIHAFRIYAVSFLFCGTGIMGSALFTALNNGQASAALSVIRSIVLQVIFVFLLPLAWGTDGIWWAVVFAEGCSAVISIIVIIAYRKRYKYL